MKDKITNNPSLDKRGCYEKASFSGTSMDNHETLKAI